MGRCQAEFAAEKSVTDPSSSHPAAAQRSADTGARSQLGGAVRRARWSIFWERLWPALARLAAVV
jgi:hypothetical protein